MFRLAVTCASVALLSLSACSEPPPPPAPVSVAPTITPSPITPITPSAPTPTPTPAAPQPEGTPFEVTKADMTIHSFHSNPRTRSGGFRMNCYPLWRDVETSRGQYNWALFDLAVRNQRKWGATNLLYSFCGTPEWAATQPADPSVEVLGPKSSAPPKSMEYYEDYVRAVVRRYKGQIGAYEVWNEASSPQFWQGTPEQMLEMTQAVKRIVKEEDPSAIVSMASMQTHREDYYKNFAVPYLRQLKRAGWPTEVYNGHFYPRGEGGPAQRRKQIAMFRKTLQALDAPDKPLWDTEVNYYVGLLGGKPDGRITGDRAAAWAVRTYLDGWRLNLRRNYWYFGTPEYNSFPGIQTTPGASATRALATFSRWVVGSRFTGCLQQRKLVDCTFERGKETFSIAWAEAGNDKDNPRVKYPLNGRATVCRLPDNTCSKESALRVDEVPVRIQPQR